MDATQLVVLVVVLAAIVGATYYMLNRKDEVAPTPVADAPKRKRAAKAVNTSAKKSTRKKAKKKVD